MKGDKYRDIYKREVEDELIKSYLDAREKKRLRKEEEERKMRRERREHVVSLNMDYDSD